MTDDKLWEHIRSLQSQIDRLVDQDEARVLRIQRLERDRQVLRDRLARTKPARRRRNLAEEVAEETTEEPPVLAVPGVGEIKPIEPAPGRPPRPLKVATVLDPISAAVFEPEFQTIPVSASGWEEALADQKPDLLLVESAYQGVDGSWSTRVARFGEPSPHLSRLTRWCRDHEVPTVFWNKEDPINFDWFIESARLFDWVFTVDGDQLPRYRNELGHDRVGLLQFFAQPALHRPGPDSSRTGTVAFAGSYYAAKHPERREQIEMVIDPAREHGLHIFDRHGHTDDERFAWPVKYQPHIVGSLSYLQTVEAYRRYRVFLNVNTVTRSSTMCARRIFELAATGTPIVTGPSEAVEGLARDGVLSLVRTADETRAAVGALLSSEDLRAERSARGTDWVNAGHLASHRVDQVLEAVGLKADPVR